MRDFFKEYLHIITSSLTVILFGIGFFYLLLNAFHASSMDRGISVSNGDTNYKEYVANVEKIKHNVDNYSYDANKFKYDIGLMNSISSKLNVCYNMLKDKGSYYELNQLTTLRYNDVYELNNYFINTLIDKCFILNISWIVRDEVYDETIYTKKVTLYNKYTQTLVNNAKYLRTELRDNSSYYFNTGVSNAMLRNNLGDPFQLVSQNYLDFSYIIADLSDYLVEGK